MPTLTFSFTVDDAATVSRIVDALAYQHGYQDQIPDPNGNPDDVIQMIDNPESKASFAKRMAKKWIRENVKAYEVANDIKTARDAKSAEIEAINIGD